MRNITEILYFPMKKLFAVSVKIIKNPKKATKACKSSLELIGISLTDTCNQSWTPSKMT